MEQLLNTWAVREVVRPVLDVLMLAYLLYKSWQILVQTRAVQLLKGTVVMIEATPDGFKEHGRFEQPDRSNKTAWPYPVIAHGKLYLRDWDTLLCYDVKGK